MSMVVVLVLERCVDRLMFLGRGRVQLVRIVIHLWNRYWVRW